MNKAKRAERHTSKVLVWLLKEISETEQTRTDNKMLLAAKIDDARKAKGGARQNLLKRWRNSLRKSTSG